MISEEQQDQAALHVLGLLSAAEAAAFESALSASAELRDLVRELREAAADVAEVLADATEAGVDEQPATTRAARRTISRRIEATRAPATDDGRSPGHPG